MDRGGVRARWITGCTAYGKGPSCNEVSLTLWRLHFNATSAAAFLVLAAPALFAQAISFRKPINTTIDQTVNHVFGGLVTGDFNGDGKPDIAYLVVFSQGTFPGGASLTVSLGNGDGTFQPGYAIPVPTGAVVLWSGDFNGDGKPDLAFWSYASDALAQVNVGVLPGKGDGSFGPAIITSFPPSFTTLNQGFGGKAFAVDVNHDGKLDVLIGTYLLLGHGDGRFDSRLISTDTADLVADLNGDGNADIVHASAGVFFSFGNGDGSFSPNSPTLPGHGGIVAGDFNGDGKIDLAFSPSGTMNYPGPPLEEPDVTLMLGRGDGSFQPPVRVLAGNYLCCAGHAPLAADFNGDGKLDLVFGSAVLAGNGDGTFRFPVHFAGPPFDCKLPCSSLPLLGIVADLNRDGLPDLILAYQQGTATTNALILSVLVNDSPGSGLLVPGVSSATSTFPVGYESLVTAFGTNLAAATAPAGPGPLPSDLGGIRLHLRGSDGVEKLAPLLYVSPTQINYLMPAGIAWPLAAVSIERDGTPFLEEAIAAPVGPSAPGLFTVNSAGLAAATAIRVASDGTQTNVPVLSCSASGCVPVPVDVTSGTVYLSLYGTGFSVNWDGSALSPANNYVGGCDVNELFAPTTYLGPQFQFPGLDQINLQLPASLAGSGDSVVDCGFRIIELNEAVHQRVRISIR